MMQEQERAVPALVDAAADGVAQPSPRTRRQGFTFIEIMITVLIIGVLARLALPYFNGQIRESRRSDAKTALLDLASREERFFATNNTYTSTANSLYGGTVSFPLYMPNGVGTNTTADYAVSVQTATSTGFLLAAIPQNNQTSDTCGAYQLDNFGTQSNPNLTTAYSGCW